MKKGLIKKILLVLVFCLSITFVKVNATSNKTEIEGAYYEVNETQETRTLDGGITYIRDISTSHADKIDKDSYGCSDLNTAPQQVNILKIPTSETLKVVNWRASERTYWKKTTVVDLAKDFEQNNPGWVVVAATNGDFFDINGNGNLPYQTNNATYSNGEMYRSANGSAVGFKNDGSSNPLVFGNFETTDFQLQIYDENDNIIGTYDITHKNEVPTNDGVAVYFTYPLSKTEKQYATIPSEDSYTVENGYMLANDINNLYAKGQISYTNTEKQYTSYEFGIVTTNEEIKSKLAIGTTIRVQKNLIGDYAQCDNVTGVGAHLISEGKATTVSDWYRHPRTTVGMTANGEIVLMTVDGRQTKTNMYGMTYQELQATMLHYGCVEMFNMDGGGSTTMIIRNAEGGFDVMNSPSDGHERADSNAVLVVAPRLNVQLDSVTDTSMSISYESAKEVSISNIILNINNESVPVNSDEFTYNKLSKNTEYEFNLSYDLTYKGKTTSYTTPNRTIKTGQQKPVLKNYSYVETGTDIFFDYEVEDPDATTTFLSLIIGRKMYILDVNSNSYVVSKSEIDSTDFKIVIDYNLRSSTNEYSSDEYVVKPYEEPEQPKKGCKKKSLELILIMNAVAVVAYLFTKKR